MTSACISLWFQTNLFLSFLGWSSIYEEQFHEEEAEPVEERARTRQSSFDFMGFRNEVVQYRLILESEAFELAWGRDLRQSRSLAFSSKPMTRSENAWNWSLSFFNLHHLALFCLFFKLFCLRIWYIYIYTWDCFLRLVLQPLQRTSSSLPRVLKKCPCGLCTSRQRCSVGILLSLNQDQSQ